MARVRIVSALRIVRAQSEKARRRFEAAVHLEITNPIPSGQPDTRELEAVTHQPSDRDETR